MKHFEFLEALPEELVLQNTPANDAWTTNNSTFSNYCESSGIHDAEETIKRQLGRLGTNVVLDIAGGTDGNALQNLLDNSIIDKGLVTNYYDSRKRHARKVEALTHIAGDILQRSTWEQIEDWRTNNAPEGFSLIMHRPFGALQNLPTGFYRGATHALLDMLRPGGILFVQIPMSLQGWLKGELGSVCSSVRQREDIDSIHMPEPVIPISSALLIKSN